MELWLVPLISNDFMVAMAQLTQINTIISSIIQEDFSHNNNLVCMNIGHAMKASYWMDLSIKI